MGRVKELYIDDMQVEYERVLSQLNSTDLAESEIFHLASDVQRLRNSIVCIGRCKIRPQ